MCRYSANNVFNNLPKQGEMRWCTEMFMYLKQNMLTIPFDSESIPHKTISGFISIVDFVIYVKI